MKLFRKATMVALSTAAIGGLAFAAPATAAPTAHLGTVTFFTTTRDDARGLSECQGRFPQTQTAQFVGIGAGGNRPYALYECYS